MTAKRITTKTIPEKLEEGIALSPQEIRQYKRSLDQRQEALNEAQALLDHQLQQLRLACSHPLRGEGYFLSGFLHHSPCPDCGSTT